jgi:dTMP kinase
MFIVIDWIDWSWKGTQVARVKESLEAMWKTVKVLDYPRYGEKSAFMVEKYLNWYYWKEIWPKLASIFYAIDRYDDSFNFREDMDKYDFVISNRYVSASMIHQAWKIVDKKEKIKFISWLEDLEYNIFGIPRPDKTIFLSVSPETSKKLLTNKPGREYIKWDKNLDIHEEDNNHMENAYKTAQMISEKLKWIKIDCEKEWEIRNIDDITNEILRKIID